MNVNVRVEHVISNTSKGKKFFNAVTDKVIKNLQHNKIHDVINKILLIRYLYAISALQ